jgi:Alpha mannosidase middle domain
LGSVVSLFSTSHNNTLRFVLKLLCGFQVNLDLMISSLENFQKWKMLNISDILGPRFHRINVFYSTPGTFCTVLLLLLMMMRKMSVPNTKRNSPRCHTSSGVRNRSDYYTAMKYQETVKATHHHKHGRSEVEQQSSRGSAVSSSISSSSTTESTTTATTGCTSIWSMKRRDDDFFPYADCPHCFWTGYFTSRTAFKRFERVASAFLQAARQMESLHILSTSIVKTTEAHNGGNQSRSPLWTLEDALGVAQHHDAVSGTAKVCYACKD